jgi:SOS-response transcriptional repressor LexA
MVSTMNTTSTEPSPRQRQVLEQIETFLRRHGRPPTRGDLAVAMKLRNRAGIDQHLRALAEGVRAEVLEMVKKRRG